MRKLISVITVLAAVITVALTGVSHASAQLPVVRNPDGTWPRVDAAGNAIQFDRNGNPIQYDSNGNLVQYDDFGNPIMNQDGMQIGDTTKVKRPRKPLESYLFPDSLKWHKTVFAWHVDTWKNLIDRAEVDTALTSKEINYPFLHKGVGDANQGRMGGASIPYNFADRPDYRNFSFAQAHDAYFVTPGTARFFNVKRPFTQFSYYTSGNARQRTEEFYITHAQNVSPSTGFNVDYGSVGNGQNRERYSYYPNGKARAKDLSVAFSYTGKKYTAHAGYIYNAILNRENGGVVDDRFITDSIIDRPSGVPMKLNDASTVIKNNTFYAVQSYGIPLGRVREEDFSIAGKSTVFVGHSFNYSTWAKKYTDTYAGTVWNTDFNGDPVQGEFYEKWYLTPTMTNDSIAETLMSNRVFVQIQPFDREGIIGTIDAGAGMDNHTYRMFRPDDYVSGTTSEKTTDYYVYGSVGGKFRSYLDWGGNIMFHPTGERGGDLAAGANITLRAFIRQRPVILSGSFGIDRRSADYWSQHMISNHFIWENSFSRENKTTFNISLKVPAWALEVRATQSLVGDMIYYDENALPAQHDGTVNVMGLYADKDFRLGGLHLRHRVLLQRSSEKKVAPVPLVTALLSYYYEFDVVKNVLRAQFGLEGRYHTKYYAPGYMPATAVFYNQRETEVGNYPAVDVFLTGKWKRMRILLKLEHANWNMLRGMTNSFTLPHYPMQRLTFKFGMSWSFYD